MSHPVLRIRRLRLLLPSRLQATAAADAREIAHAAALAVHRSVGPGLGGPGLGGRDVVLELPAIHTQGGGRPVAALAHEVGQRVGSATRGRRGD